MDTRPEGSVSMERDKIPLVVTGGVRGKVRTTLNENQGLI